jgi:hypothetical protein
MSGLAATRTAIYAEECGDRVVKGEFPGTRDL